MSFPDTHEEFPFQSPVFLPPSLKAPLDTCLPGKTTPFTAQNLASLVFIYFLIPVKIFTQSALYICIVCSLILSSENQGLRTC